MKTSNMDELDIILGLEGGTVTIEDYDDWCRVKDLARDWSRSQGFYGRLLRDMIEFEEHEDLVYPFYM